tara:strand:+ start:28 stop:189 length:162 start_codon:yes stop_codon:yes gene_type:complete
MSTKNLSNELEADLETLNIREAKSLALKILYLFLVYHPPPKRNLCGNLYLKIF